MKIDKNSPKNEWISLLSKNVVSVTFEKTNGERRTIKGTLRQDLLPPRVEEERHNDSNYTNSQIVPIYETETGLWKSFYIERVIDCNVC